MYILSIFIGGHDNSISLLKDGELVFFIAEERISRIKHDRTLPFISLKEVINYTKTIDYLIISPTDNLNFIMNNLLKFRIKVKEVHIAPTDSHHKCHAASSFYSSGFEEAYCLIMDAFGGHVILPGTTDTPGVSTTTIFYANLNKFETKYSLKYYNPFITSKTPFKLAEHKDPVINFSSHFDIGLIYASICNHLGWKSIDGGKLMGLSSYGKFNHNIPSLLYKNTLLGNMNLFIGDQSINIKSNPELLESASNYNTQQAKDLAYSAQKVLEKFFRKRINQILKMGGTKNIVLSGGCFMNVVGNYILQKEFPDINFYVDPLSTDAGISYGQAKYLYHELTNSTKIDPLKSLYQGPSYSKKDLLNSIQKYV